jgi:hypothetical protein
MLRVKAVFPLDCGRTGGEADLMGGAKHGAGMSTQILQLYPHTGTTRALNGTYLAHELHALGTSEQPFVYANFVSSLDGRIAVVEAHTGESYVLEDLTSGHDWRLFQELQAQADCMVTHGGYRNGSIERTITTPEGTRRVTVPRGRIAGTEGRTTEFHSQLLPRYARRTREIDDAILNRYLGGVNSRCPAGTCRPPTVESQAVRCHADANLSMLAARDCSRPLCSRVALKP